MLRFVVDEDGRLTVDVWRRAPGRGAHVCPTLDCIRSACRRSAWGRALGREIERVRPEELWAGAVRALRARIDEMRGTALRDGRARWLVPEPVTGPVALVTCARLQRELELDAELVRRLEAVAPLQ